MSKAFVKEDAPIEPEAPDLRARLGEGPRYVTPAGYERLRAEREALAAGPSGPSDHRLRWLDLLLEHLTVVHPDPAQAGRAFFGAWVTVEDEEDEAGEVRTVQLVGPDEEGVSVASPLGRALLGRSEGDEVVVQLPGGRQRLTVVAIRYA